MATLAARLRGSGGNAGSDRGGPGADGADGAQWVQENQDGQLLFGYEGVGEAHSFVSGGSVSARGVLYVHSAPAALCPHVEWAVAGVVGVPVKLDWSAQQAAPGAHRAELNWQGAPGTSGAIASAL